MNPLQRLWNGMTFTASQIELIPVSTRSKALTLSAATFAALGNPLWIRLPHSDLTRGQLQIDYLLHGVGTGVFTGLVCLYVAVTLHYNEKRWADEGVRAAETATEQSARQLSQAMVERERHRRSHPAYKPTDTIEEIMADPLLLDWYANHDKSAPREAI